MTTKFIVASNEMFHRFILGFAVVLLSGTGCLQPRMTLDDLKAKLPERPAELDRLDLLVGEWDTQGTIKMIGMDGPIETTGHNVARWSADGWLLIDESTYEMGALGMMSGVSLWSWDDRAKRYHVDWYDSFGERASGYARYDEASRTWHLKTSGRSALCSVANKGTIKVVGDGHLAWTYDQWDAWGWLKFSEMRGHSQRR